MTVVSFGVRDAATLRREGGNVAVRPGKWGYRLERLASPIAFGVREDRDACGRVIANLGLRWDSLADRCNGELVSWTIVERETVTLYGTLSVTAGRVLLRLAHSPIQHMLHNVLRVCALQPPWLERQGALRTPHGL